MVRKTSAGRRAGMGAATVIAAALIVPLGMTGASAELGEQNWMRAAPSLAGSAVLAPETPERVTVPVSAVGIQMYSLGPWVQADGLESVLSDLSDIGFENIEPYGGNFDGYTAEEFRALTDSVGLHVPSSHYNVGEADFDETLEFVKTLGQEYVGSGGFAEPGVGTYEDTLETAKTMDRLGQMSIDAGVGKFFGHNHDSELKTVYTHNGQEMMAWEILIAETDPDLVTFELDVAWAAHANADVVDLLEQYGDRISMLHIKDGTNLGGDGRPTFTNLGEGENDLQAILAAAQDVDIAYYIMEYDMAADGRSFATEGFEYLTGLKAGTPTEAQPIEVTFSDTEGTFTIPEVEGVEYLLNGEVINPGDHAGQGTVTITAQALEGYVLTENATTTWTHEFTDEGNQPDPTDPPAEEPTDEPGNGGSKPGVTNPDGSLPKTGANVGMLTGLAALFLLAGVGIARQSRRSII